MSTNTVTNRNTSGDRRRHTSGVTPFPILHQPPRLLDHRVADGARFGMDGSSELDPGVHVAQGRDEHLERRAATARGRACGGAAWTRGFRKAEGGDHR